MQLPGLNAGDYLEHNVGFAVGKGIAVGGGNQTYKIVATSTGFSLTGTWAASGVTTFADGTAAAPSIAFTNSTGTGLYRNAANVIGTALGGVAALALGVAAPTIAAATDTAGTDVYEYLADAGATATAARAGGSYYKKAGAGSVGTTTVNGGAGGAITETAGAGGAKTGTGTANAGAGGGNYQVGGAGGANASTNAGSTAGAGGVSVLIGGAGGDATAGAIAGNGGPVKLQPGAAGAASGGSTAGNAGIAMVAGTAPMPFAECQVYTALADADATLTAAQHRGGIISVAAGANSRTITTLTAAQLVAAFPGVQVGSSVPLEVLSLKTTANTVTMAGGANVTAVGSMVVDVNAVPVGQAVRFKILFTNVGSGTEAAQLIRVAG